MCCGHVFNEKRNTTPNTRTTSGYFGNAAKNKATQVKSLLQHVLRFLTALFFHRLRFTAANARQNMQ